MVQGFDQVVLQEEVRVFVVIFEKHLKGLRCVCELGAGAAGTASEE